MMNQTEFFRVFIPSGIRVGAATLGTFLSRDAAEQFLSDEDPDSIGHIEKVNSAGNVIS